MQYIVNQITVRALAIALVSILRKRLTSHEFENLKTVKSIADSDACKLAMDEAWRQVLGRSANTAPSDASLSAEVWNDVLFCEFGGGKTPPKIDPAYRL